MSKTLNLMRFLIKNKLNHITDSDIFNNLIE